MSNFDQVLSRIQSQLESMKKSLVYRREEHSEGVRQKEWVSTPQKSEEPDRKNVPDPDRR